MPGSLHEVAVETEEAAEGKRNLAEMQVLSFAVRIRFFLFLSKMIKMGLFHRNGERHDPQSHRRTARQSLAC